MLDGSGCMYVVEKQHCCGSITSAWCKSSQEKALLPRYSAYSSIVESSLSFLMHAYYSISILPAENSRVGLEIDGVLTGQ
jgi:hypothetical protein